MKTRLLVLSAMLAIAVAACDNKPKATTESGQKAEESAKKAGAAVGAAAEATKEAAKDAAVAAKESAVGRDSRCQGGHQGGRRGDQGGCRQGQGGGQQVGVGGFSPSGNRAVWPGFVSCGYLAHGRARAVVPRLAAHASGSGIAGVL
jgi:hypothetical protein